MISEKDKKIVAAVFATKGAFPHDEDEEMSQIIMAKREFDGYSVGEFQGGNSVRTNEYWEFICTIEEYNQCVEDMERARWMTNGDSYSAYKYNCGVFNIDTSNKTLLKENCDYSFYDKPLVYTQEMVDNGREIECGMLFSDTNGEYKAVFVNRKSVAYENEYGFLFGVSRSKCHPIKTPEQIKQDKLNEQALVIKATLICDGRNLELSVIKHILKNFTVEPK